MKSHNQDSNCFSVDFDWDELYRRFDEAEKLGEVGFSEVAEGIGELLDWIIGGGPINQTTANRIGRRAIALCWILRPAMFGGASVTSIAKALGVTAPVMATITAEASRYFGIRNHAQTHAWNWQEARPEGPAALRQAPLNEPKQQEDTPEAGTRDSLPVTPAGRRNCK